MATTNKIRFGVVGTNFITDWVIAGARQDERFELVAVYSRTQETADTFAARHPDSLYISFFGGDGAKSVDRCGVYCFS